MTALAGAIDLQQRALSDLERSRNASSAWSDEQRERLEHQCLEPLLADGHRLLQAIRLAAREIAMAQTMLSP